jgi:hypothetical protein
MRVEKEVQEKNLLPGYYGCPLSLLKFPQDWGIQGVDYLILSS